MSRVRRWSVLNTELVLTEESIRTKFRPESEWRISRFEYPAGSTIDGAMRSGECFVLAGEVCYANSECSTMLAKGDIAALPSGKYSLRVIGDHSAQIVMCWPLSEFLLASRAHHWVPDRAGLVSCIRDWAHVEYDANISRDDVEAFVTALTTDVDWAVQLSLDGVIPHDEVVNATTSRIGAWLLQSLFGFDSIPTPSTLVVEERHKNQVRAALFAER